MTPARRKTSRKLLKTPATSTQRTAAHERLSSHPRCCNQITCRPMGKDPNVARCLLGDMLVNENSAPYSEPWVWTWKLYTYFAKMFVMSCSVTTPMTAIHVCLNDPTTTTRRDRNVHLFAKRNRKRSSTTPAIQTRSNTSRTQLADDRTVSVSDTIRHHRDFQTCFWEFTNNQSITFDTVRDKTDTVQPDIEKIKYQQGKTKGKQRQLRS